MKRSNLRRTRIQLAFRCATLLLLFASSMAVAFAQQLEDVAPPPPRAYSNDEQAQLAAAERHKRLRISLELATNRLVRAEGFTTQRQYAAASAELGAYQALVEDALNYIQKQVMGGKQRDFFKRFEQTLRAHTLRIEAMRRITPPSYAVHVATTIKIAQRARTQALDGFFGAEVMRDDAPASPSVQSRSADTSVSTEARPPTSN